VHGGLHVVKDTDHHLFLNNPINMVEKMLLATYGDEEAETYKEMKEKN